jgi:hypothetical protein
MNFLIVYHFFGLIIHVFTHLIAMLMKILQNLFADYRLYTKERLEILIINISLFIIILRMKILYNF